MTLSSPSVNKPLSHSDFYPPILQTSPSEAVSVRQYIWQYMVGKSFSYRLHHMAHSQYLRHVDVFMCERPSLRLCPHFIYYKQPTCSESPHTATSLCSHSRCKTDHFHKNSAIPWSRCSWSFLLNENQMRKSCLGLFPAVEYYTVRLVFVEAGHRLLSSRTWKFTGHFARLNILHFNIINIIGNI